MKRIIIQTIVVLAVAVVTLYISNAVTTLNVSDFLNDNDTWNLSYYFFDDFTLINIGFGNLVILLVFPILCALVLFRRHKETPKLDKIIKIFLYASIANFMVGLIYHFTYLIIRTEGYGLNYLSFYYRTDDFFWLKITLSTLFYLIPAVLLFLVVKIGLNKKTAEIKQ